MASDQTVGENTTRRSVLARVLPAGFLASAAWGYQKSQPLPRAGEFFRFADPTTETTITRLTSPAYSHFLPAQTKRFLSLKSRTLFCSSDRAGGGLAPFGIDLRTGAIRQLAEAPALDPTSLTLDESGRNLYFLSGGSLSEVSVSGKAEIKKATVLAQDVTAFGMGGSRSEIFGITSGKLRQLNTHDSPVLADEAAGPLVVRPAKGGCLFTRPISAEEREFWYSGPANTRPVMLASGRASDPYWSADGESLLFLRDVPKNDVFVAEVHEVKPEEKVERCVSRTSQFATFGPNGNDSVFVGASGSKAQPNVVLLLRVPERELTLCEHRSSNAAQVRPVFSPDSRRVYFQSDREGKSAIYSVNVEQLVEPT